jgi:hypothetical protein
MIVKDAVGVLLVVAESRGRYWTAALFDALSDIATVGVTIYGAGTVLIDGWSAHTFAVLGAMMVTSFAGTAFWTRMSVRWMPLESSKAEVAGLGERLTALESRRPENVPSLRADPWNRPWDG